MSPPPRARPAPRPAPPCPRQRPIYLRECLARLNKTSKGAEGDPSSAFTVQLATMLAADETALSQPIALRVLQQSGLLRPSTAPGDAQGVALPPMFSQAQR